MYSLNALRYAEAAARLGSFSAAARECGVSQPTVSAAVADLEVQLGNALLARGGRVLTLTPAGERLLPRITAVLQTAEELRAETTVLVSSARAELRIGFTPLVGAARLALLAEPFTRQHPGTRLVFFESSVTDLEKRLKAGQLDVIMGCGFRPAPNIRRQKLFKDHLVVCAKEHRGGTASGATLEAVCAQRLLFTEDLCGLASATRELIAAAGLTVDPYPGRAMSYGALEDWVELGLGQAVMPKFHVRNRALAHPLVDAKGAPLVLHIEAAWPKSLAAVEHAAQFLAFVHRVVPGLGDGLASAAQK